VIDGEHIRIANLSLDGALEVNNHHDEELRLSDLDIKNEGWQLIEIENPERVSEELAIRGFEIFKKETKILAHD